MGSFLGLWAMVKLSFGNCALGHIHGPGPHPNPKKSVESGGKKGNTLKLVYRRKWKSMPQALAIINYCN
jgi:hypothetical protein